MKVVILSALSILLLSGCASGIDLIQTESNEVERTKLDLPMAEPVDLRDPNWVVITPENAEEILSELQDRGYDPVIFGLTDIGYQRLSIDFAKIREHINTQRNVLLQYKQYYEDAPDSPPVSSE